jgi:ADP-ribose pyrophosphatase YjhB (NUDIX family)
LAKANVWLAAAGVVLKGGEVLAVQKAYGGLKGRWSLPAGFVQPGETVDQAAVREVYEETGVTAIVKQIAAVRTGVIKEEISDNMIVFVMEYVQGEPRPRAGEIVEARFFPIGELLAHPLATDYMRIFLPKALQQSESLSGRDYTPDPVFGYTSYRIFS